jgi:hypothetical protein
MTLPEFWCDTYKRARGVRYVGFEKSDGVILAKLARNYGDATVRALIGKYLKLEDDRWIAQAGWNVRAFSQRIRGLYCEHVKQYGEAAVEEANQRREDLKRAPGKLFDLADRIGKRMT